MIFPALPEVQAIYIRPDPSRVIVRPFRPTIEPRDFNRTDKSRANHIVDRVLSLDAELAVTLLEDVMESFDFRHRELSAIFEKRADGMQDAFTGSAPFSEIQRLLIGAYFLQEYSFESSALFNPSIVPHPDQVGLEPGAVRFVLSLRSVGEGHVSSLTFRSGISHADGSITLNPTARLAALPEILARTCRLSGDDVDVAFDPCFDISERVIFPVTPAQSNGIEDARFVLVDDDGIATYFATYTAYNGRDIRSELLKTTDFVTFCLSPMTGAATGNKGMALFPRKINGQYAMIARQDNENLYLLYSDDLYHWENGLELLRPEFPWEFVQIGNCGSPVELDEGWLVFIHGVGAVRKYSIGAVLLDKQDPSRVIGRTREPIVRPEMTEREGYVPNVVYTCGAMRHGKRIILPYAVSDTFTKIIVLEIADLLEVLRAGAPDLS